MIFECMAMVVVIIIKHACLSFLPAIHSLSTTETTKRYTQKKMCASFHLFMVREERENLGWKVSVWVMDRTERSVVNWPNIILVHRQHTRMEICTLTKQSESNLLSIFVGCWPYQSTRSSPQLNQSNLWLSEQNQRRIRAWSRLQFGPGHLLLDYPLFIFNNLYALSFCRAYCSNFESNTIIVHTHSPEQTKR